MRPQGVYLYLRKYETPIKRFINSLNEFSNNKDTYPNPEQYLEMLKSSVATEINNIGNVNFSRVVKLTNYL